MSKVIVIKFLNLVSVIGLTSEKVRMTRYFDGDKHNFTEAIALLMELYPNAEVIEIRHAV